MALDFLRVPLGLPLATAIAELAYEFLRVCPTFYTPGSSAM